MQPSLRLTTLIAVATLAPAILNGVPDLPSTLTAHEKFASLPLAFEPNASQFDPQVRFVAHSPDMTVFFTETEVVMVLRKAAKPELGRLHWQMAPTNLETAVVRMKWEGAGRPRQAIGLDKLPGIANYFIGSDRTKWRTNIPTYARIEYKGVYPGVDFVCYGHNRRLEYDLVVAAGADPNRIDLAWEGADRIMVNKDGDLVLTTRLGDIIQKRPLVVQNIAGRLVEVASKYRIVGGRQVRFELAAYDRNRALRIDPVVLAYSTYLGGSSVDGDKGQAIAVDRAGSAYVTGVTNSVDFPTRFPYQSTYRRAGDVFVSKLSASGNALVYSTYFGGTSGEDGTAIAVDSSGSAYVTGYTSSSDFPITQVAFQKASKGQTTGFVTKLAPAGNTLVYSTYLGGSSYFGDFPWAIAVDTAGSAYVAGSTTAKDFPTRSAYQTTLKGTWNTAFVTKLTTAGDALVYSTYLGGSGSSEAASAIAVDAAGAAYVTGSTNSTDFPMKSAFQSTLKNSYSNAFVTKLAPAGNALVYSTFLGGNGAGDPLSETGETGHGIAVDSSGSAYVTGRTNSTDFPTQAAYQSGLKGHQDGFVTKFSVAGNTLVYSTYLGGSHQDEAFAIAVDSAGSAYVTGFTDSNDFPVLSAYQATLRSSEGNAFVTKLALAGNALVYSTYLGGTGGYGETGYGIAVDDAGAAYVTGISETSDFPTVTPIQNTNKSGAGNAFVTKLTFSGTSGIAVTITTNPSGLTLTIDNVAYTAPQTFNWSAGSQHTLDVASPQGTGTRYIFGNWSDGGAQNHTVTTPSTATTYTATFSTQYLLITSVSPSSSGTIAASPASPDGYYNSGTTVRLTASPTGAFTNWSGDASGSANPVSLAMNAPKSVTANFGGAAMLPDLVVTALRSPNQAVMGRKMGVSATVVNQGKANAGAFRVGFYFSTTPNISTSAVDSGYDCSFTSLAAGASVTCKGSIDVPGRLTNGMWYVGAMADPTNAMAESDKSNNSHCLQLRITKGKLF